MATPLTERLARQASGESHREFELSARQEPVLATLPLAAIDPDPNQPRKDKGDVSDLALSIHEEGLIQPIIVEPMPGGRYRILAGERRFEACRQLRWESIPAIVRTVKEQSRLAQQIIENIHRKELNPIEEARALRRLMEEFNLSQRDVARRIGRSVGAVNQVLRILDLPSEILDSAATLGPTNKSVLLEIVKETDRERQDTLWEQAKSGTLTVREARGRTSRRPAPKLGGGSRMIQVPEATLRVEFASGEVSDLRVIEALRAALEVVQTAVSRGPQV